MYLNFLLNIILNKEHSFIAFMTLKNNIEN